MLSDPLPRQLDATTDGPPVPPTPPDAGASETGARASGGAAFGAAVGAERGTARALGWQFESRRRRRDGTSRAFRAIKAQHAVVLTPIERVAHRLTLWASTTRFLALHVLWFGGWIAWNTRLLPPLRPFDPYPFGLLTMIVSLEAIFLSLFVLMSQNRESAIAELREEVTLAVNLRVEEEVTKVLQLVSGLYTRLGYAIGEDGALDEMLQPLDAEEIERELVAQIAASMSGARNRG
jgi:uncharacterized membrane protein